MSRQRRADVALRAQSRKYQQDLRNAEGYTKRFAKNTKRTITAGFRDGFGSIATLGTVAGIADVGRDLFGFEEQLVRLDIQASGKADIEGIRQAANDMRAEFGVARTETAAAAEELVNLLGGIAATADGARVLTTRMVGTGAEMRDLAGLVQVMEQQFGLKGAENWAKGLDRMIGVGKLGSVPLKDLSVVAKQSAAVFARLGGEGAEGVGQLAASLQIAEQAFGTPAQGATALMAMVEGLENATIMVPALRKELGQVGTDQFVGLEEALIRLGNSKFFTNKKLFRDTFTSAPARNMITALIQNREAFDAMVEAGREGEQMQVGYADAQTVAKSNAGQMRIAMGNLRAEVEKLFTPERTAIMIDAMKKLASAVGFVIDNWQWFLAAFVAIKAIGIGRNLLKWAAAAKKMAGGASAATRAIRALGGAGDALGGGMGVAGGKGASSLQKAAGGAIAFGTGFEIGSLLEEEFGVGTKALNVLGIDTANERAQKRHNKRIRRMRDEGAEMQSALDDLMAADMIGPGGEINPELVRSLRVSQTTGRQKSRLEEAAQTALGFRTSEGRALAKSSEVGFSGFFEARRMGAEERGAESQDRAAREDRLLAALEALAARPIEVKIDGDKVATAVANAPQNQRSPAQ